MIFARSLYAPVTPAGSSAKNTRPVRYKFTFAIVGNDQAPLAAPLPWILLMQDGVTYAGSSCVAI